MAIQLKTARLTVLLDPSKKLAFERACREGDMTPSQVLRHLIRDYVQASEMKVRPATPTRREPAPAKRVARHG
ncbi:CopG family transcriptional regulator [Ramlibacter sp. MMS24-I3-19]|uniref:CopG family transcriptional regulator n=1 Tax=Ramlibacter sp. MMS24-I3-19 TaxID=3416606 RepID=UPI003CFF0C8B